MSMFHRTPTILKFTALNVANELPDVVMTNSQRSSGTRQSGCWWTWTDEVENGQN